MIVRKFDATSSGVYMLAASPSGGLYNAVDITAQLGASGILGSGNNLLPYSFLYTGDFNGDGKTDLLLVVPYAQVQTDPQYHAYLLTAAATSNGYTFFNPPVEVTASTGLTPYQWGTGRIIIADFDGDGRDDLLFPDINNADTAGPNATLYWAEVATMNASTGTFNRATTITAQAAMAQGDWQLSHFTTLDLNGDGRHELLALVQTNAGPQQRAVLFEPPLVGSGIQLFDNGVDVTNDWGMSAAIWQCANPIPGDFNGDGKTDLLIQQSASCYATGTNQPTYLLYANGNETAPSFATTVAFANKIDVTTITGMDDDKWRNATIFTGDFDGDGKTDLLLRRELNPQVSGNDTLMLRSTGNGFGIPLAVTTMYGMTWDKWTDVIRIGDFNGTGIDDIFVQADTASGSPARPLIMATANPGNVITGVANGYGATTVVTYVPSTNWVNTNNPPLMQTVTSVTTADGRTGDPTQVADYDYAGAAWDPVERRALGFRYVQAKYPNDPTNAYEQTYFYQGAAYESGEVQEHYLLGLGGVTDTHTVRTLTSSSIAPWVSNLTEQDDTGCDSGANCKTVGKTYAYDPYGDVKVLTELGDTAVSGDERATVTEYATIGNRVNVPEDVAVRQGSSAGAVLKETKYANFNDGEPQIIQFWVNGTTPHWVTTYATYDAYGNKASDTDALGHITSTGWATLYGRLPTSRTDALNRITTLNPNMPCSGEASMFDPNGGSTHWTYDGLCRKLTESRPDGGTTTWSYNEFGYASQNVGTEIRDTQGDNQTTTSYFDGLGREYENENNAGDVVLTTYDPRGLVASVSAPGAGTGGPVTNYTYDARRRLTATSFPGGTRQSSVYTGWTTTTTDEAGKLRTLTHDAYNQIRQVNESVSSTKPCVNGATAYLTTINYDLLGHQLGYTDACGDTSVTTFDSLGRVVTRKDPDMGSWSYKYDDGNRLLTQTDAKAQVITSTYDALNRLLGTTNNKDASSTSFTYDLSPHFPLGRLTTATSVSAGGYAVSTAYDYDVVGHAISEAMTIGTRSYTSASTFDGMGHVRTMTYPNVEKLTYGYDTRGMQDSLVSTLFKTPLVSSATYDPRRNPVTRSLGNHVAESYSYDPNRFWLTGVAASHGTTSVHDVSLPRDPRGLVEKRTNALDPTDNWSYTYDGVRRLTDAKNTGKAAWSEAFTFDPINRVITSSKLGTYSYPAVGSSPADAPTSIVLGKATTSNTYDPNGNLLTSGSNSFTYDVNNRPTVVNGQSTGYDGGGTRVFQGPIDFVGGDNYEFDNSVGVPTRYYYFNGERIASALGSAQTFYLGDQLNSATTLTDGTGNVLSRQVLSPFGRRLEASTDPIALGGVRLDTTGLYTMGAREMHPNLGVFITPDPSGAPDAEKPQTLNRYAYANNSPTNLVDLTGFDAQSPEDSEEDIAAQKRLNPEHRTTAADYVGTEDHDARTRYIGSVMVSWGIPGASTAFYDPDNSEFAQNARHMSDPTEGLTMAFTDKTVVHVSKEAFYQPFQDFGSALWHEGVHVLQYLRYQKAGLANSNVLFHINEVEAYDRQMSPEDPFFAHMTKEGMEGFTGQRDAEYNLVRLYSAKNAKLMDTRQFDCSKAQCDLP
jgi:RHS repeat-associated protein